jgi:hypothetical protein
MTSIIPGFSQKAEELGPAHSLFIILAGREQSLSGAFRPLRNQSGAKKHQAGGTGRSAV